MYIGRLVPKDFAVPERLECGSYHLRMLSIDDVEKDFEAVVESTTRLKGLLDPESTWPDGLTLKEDLIDLGWHQREFTLGRSFAYTVMSSDESRCLGCAYIFPSATQAYDAAVFYWVRSGEEESERDRELGNHLRAWLEATWPFKKIAFPGREIAWDAWKRMTSAAG